VSALPFFFGIGLVATPDATLTAAWAGALYFLGRALLEGKARAWIGVGICLGLGLLAKYTIALLIPASGLFMLLDAGARRWWRRPQPYLALALTAVLFLPVIYWNSQHAWVSFLFQTAGRLRETAHFSVHELLGATLFLLTPTGLVAAILALGSRDNVPSSDPSHTAWARRRRFILLFTIVPLAVFVIFSLRHHTKLNWTGPTWLAVLPAVAWMMTRSATPLSDRVVAFVRRLWMPTIVTVVVLYGALLHYLVLGLPGTSYPAFISDIAGWKDLQRQIAAVENRIAERTNLRPIVVGMDRYNIASELAFYGYPDGPPRTAGRHLFGEVSLMYRYWFPEPEQDGKTMILVARQEGQLINNEVVSRFDSLGTVTGLPVRWNGQIVRTYYCRVGFGYRARAASSAQP
jgi:dolichol-phosphate mannosyltransferase